MLLTETISFEYIYGNTFGSMIFFSFDNCKIQRPCRPKDLFHQACQLIHNMAQIGNQGESNHDRSSNYSFFPINGFMI